MQIENLFTDGYATTIDDTPYHILSPLIGASLTKIFDDGLEQIVETPEIVAKYKEVEDYLANTYVSQLSPTYTAGYRSMWNHSDSGTKEWHNDLKEGCNIFFMYYFNTPESGGELCFRTGQEVTGEIKPQPKLLVLGSQELVYEHKVLEHKGDRWAFNLGFSI